MAQKQKMLEKQYLLQQEKGQLIEKKIDGIIDEQAEYFEEL